MTQRSDIANAIAETLVTPPPGISSIIRQTTLAGAYNHTIDLGLLSLTSSTGFAESGILALWDGAGEKYQSISSISGDDVTLRLRPGQTALQHDHDAGAIVSTNLAPFFLPAVAPMIMRSADPVVFIQGMQSQEMADRSKAGHAPWTFRITVIRQVQQTEQTAYDDNLWSIDQQEYLDADLSAIKAALRNNLNLNASNGANIESWQSPVFTESWESDVEREGITVSIARLDFRVIGRTPIRR
jgi:hypothetical protein